MPGVRDRFITDFHCHEAVATNRRRVHSDDARGVGESRKILNAWPGNEAISHSLERKRDEWSKSGKEVKKEKIKGKLINIEGKKQL